MNKLFIIGLPRTGTTSTSVALLEHGFKVAHTAFTQQTFALAEAFSDTPCYCDYRQLDQLFPKSKFVYLDRTLELWVPSIKMLLTKMQQNLKPQGHFNPIMKRCFNEIFSIADTDEILSPAHLRRCYQKHQQQVFEYFDNNTDFLSINVSKPGGLSTLLNFLDVEAASNLDFPHINAGRMVTAWKDIKHPNKINSNASGPARRKFLDYSQICL